MSPRPTIKALAGLAAAGLALSATALLPPSAGAAGGGAPAAPAPTMMVGDVRIEEGDAGLRVAKVPITLSAPLPEVAYFTFATPADRGSATAGEDYRPKNVRKKIAAGKTATVVTVPIFGDDVVEGDETIQVLITVLDAPPVAVIKKHGVISIDNDDETEGAVPVVSTGATRLYEGDAGKRAHPVVFALSEAQASDVNVKWHTEAGTATAGSDFKLIASKTTRIPAGRVQKSELVVLYGDTDAETDEDFNIVIDSVTGGDGVVASTNPASGLILVSDDDTDTDGDYLVDGCEMWTKTDPLDPDSDGDQLLDGIEMRVSFTNPNQFDTDNDGYDDLIELKSGTDPNNPADHP